MRISVTRTGGFAGRTRSGTLETAGRPDAARLHALAHEALDAPAPTGTPVVPDGFSYQVTVGDTSARWADPHLTEAQRALVRAVLEDGVPGETEGF